jgi:hypothetical protein
MTPQGIAIHGAIFFIFQSTSRGGVAILPSRLLLLLLL